MTNISNVLLISDNTDITDAILKKLALLRNSDKVKVIETNALKNTLSNSDFQVIILCEIENNRETTLKIIKQIKDINPGINIILQTEETDVAYLLNTYDAGIYDFITFDDDDYQIMIKVLNGIKFSNQKSINNNDKIFLKQLGAIDIKTDFYKHSIIKEAFNELLENKRFKNGVFAIVTLDKNIRTKVSTNRLSIAIKNCTRESDIIAQSRGGLFYLFLLNTNIENAKNVIQKIQDKMGENFPIRSGLNRIRIQEFSTLEKNTKDSLESAIQNNEMCVSLTDKFDETDEWLLDDKATNKHFKLFQAIFNNKLKNIIEPEFYKFQKECNSKLQNTMVSQYANNIESVFSLKNNNLHSELIIHYNGFTEFNIEITHSGLDSCENSKININLNEFSKKELNKLLKQLKQEYIESTK